MPSRHRAAIGALTLALTAPAVARTRTTCSTLHPQPLERDSFMSLTDTQNGTRNTGVTATGPLTPPASFAAGSCEHSDLLERAATCTAATRALADEVRSRLGDLARIVARAEQRAAAEREADQLELRVIGLREVVAALDAADAADAAAADAAEGESEIDVIEIAVELEAEAPTDAADEGAATEPEAAPDEPQSDPALVGIEDAVLIRALRANTEVRTWAREAGLAVAATGRIRNDHVLAWVRAHQAQAAELVRAFTGAQED